MITKIHRFHGHGSLRFVYQRGETIRGQFGSIKFVRNSRRQTYRMAVVVSRKVHKSAVVRNRIRRRLYEVVRRAEPRMTGPFDLVFTVFSDQVAELEAAELEFLVLSKLEKAGILSASAPKVAQLERRHAIVKAKETKPA